MKNFTIVTVTPDHADHLISMIHELAEFEKMKSSVVNTAERLRKDIENKAVHGFIAFDGEVPAGMNLYYYAYSTWVGQVNHNFLHKINAVLQYLHMEDLYIRPQFRRMGLARLLWKKLAELARDKEIARLEWAVLDWNTNAIALYDTVDYVNLTKSEGWYTFRMDGKAINKFANE
uniref:N-acetyltransferase domain-containing protein n=1 Tax=Caenorhabditis tropicalis TaxID=1561998 RepID=A0A1I7UBY2_9PELO